MKKSVSILSVIALIALTSCNKTLPKPEQINVNPAPLAVVGGQINAEITGTFPVKKFAKKGVLTVTPVLKYGSQEVLGEPTVYVGEKVKENGARVSYSKGGSYSQTFSCAYKDEMAKSNLYLRFEAKVGKKTIEIPDVKVAEGVMATEQLATAADNKPCITPDKFQRVIQELQEADIKFLIQQANLRNSETKSEGVKNLQNAIKDANSAENKEINKIEIAGYASPDGAMSLNENLANKRQEVTQKFLNKQLKKDKITANIDSKVTAEDWDGFQKLMENSNIQDKQLVLRVLSMYSDPEEREAQIKNLSAVYKNIAEEILPALRRSRMILTTDIIGKSDDQIKELAASDPAKLSVEELLYAATLSNDNNEKVRIYKKVIELYPNEYRAYNNIALIQFNEGNVADARRNYAKALEIEPNNADVNYNAGIAALADKDFAKAEECFGKAAGTTGNLSAAMGTLYTLKGEYAKAKNAYGNANTNNAAVQQILNEDYTAARQTLSNVENPNATTAYLLAVVGARTNDRDAVYTNMRQAVAKDAALKAQAKSDIEFAKFAEDEQFLSIIK